MKHLTSVVAFVVITLMFNSCSKDDSPVPASGGTGRLKMYLADAPSIVFDAVNIVVDRVEVHLAGADSTSGWTTINDTQYTYDLLTLRNGQTAILGNAVLAAGTYTQIRLIISTGSNVVVGGVPFSLGIPSGMQTGLKLVHEFTIQPNGTTELTFDFDAERSVNLTGNGQYMLKPVIRVQSNDVSGSVSGTVFQPDARATVWTNVGSDTVLTQADTTNGSFRLVALPQGSYSIRFVTTVAIYSDTTINGVVVSGNHDTNLGTVILPSP